MDIDLLYGVMTAGVIAALACLLVAVAVHLFGIVRERISDQRLYAPSAHRTNSPGSPALANDGDEAPAFITVDTPTRRAMAVERERLMTGAIAVAQLLK